MTAEIILTDAANAESECARAVRLALLDTALVRVHAYSSSSLILREALLLDGHGEKIEN